MTRQPHTPTQIAAAFEAVGRIVPHAEARELLCNALSSHRDDIDHLVSSIIGDRHCSLVLRQTAMTYQDALIEAANPEVFRQRLLIDAAERDFWALKSQAEADYRAQCAKHWEAQGDARMAEEYGSRAKAELLFVDHCRERATALRNQAASLSHRVAA